MLASPPVFTCPLPSLLKHLALLSTLPTLLLLSTPTPPFMCLSSLGWGEAGGELLVGRGDGGKEACLDTERRETRLVDGFDVILQSLECPMKNLIFTQQVVVGWM